MKIDIGYVSNSLKKCDIGFSFDSIKPVAFICTSIFNSYEREVEYKKKSKTKKHLKIIKNKK